MTHMARRIHREAASFFAVGIALLLGIVIYAVAWPIVFVMFLIDRHDAKHTQIEDEA